MTVTLKTTRRKVRDQGDDTSLCLYEILFTSPHQIYSFHHHVTTASIKEISSKAIDYKRKKRKKQKREKRRKEEPYPKEISLTYPSIPPFSTHFNIPYASEMKKNMKV